MQQRRFAPTSPRAAGRPPPGARPGGFCSANAFALAVAALAALTLPAATARAQVLAAAGPPTTVPVPTAPAGGWSAWTPVAGPSFLSPSLALNPVADALDLASVGLDLSVSYTRVANGAGSAPLLTGRLTFLPPVILADAAGTPQLLVTGSDGMVTHSRFQASAWSAPIPTGAVSFLPPAATLNSAGGTLELVSVAADGGLRH